VEKGDIMKDAVEIIRRRLPGAEFRILLFGSWARGDAQENSDFDIGLMGPEAVDDMLFLRIKEETRSIPTLRRIDVVDLSQADENFRREVLSHARGL
jgi:predicted nucleotidyltransferase